MKKEDVVMTKDGFNIIMNLARIVIPVGGVVLLPIGVASIATASIALWGLTVHGLIKRFSRNKNHNQKIES